MNEEPRLIAAFRGGVSCRRDPEGPLGLTLIGRTHDRPGETVSIAFTAAAPVGMPEAVEDVKVECLGPNTYRIRDEEREWIVPAQAIHVHREVATAFYRVVVPRPPRFTKRLFWRVVLAAVRNPVAKRVLLAFRRR